MNNRGSKALAKTLKERESYIQRTVLNTIQKVMDRTAGKPMEVVKKEMKANYPFGERKGQEYKIWNRLTNEAFYIRERIG